MADYPSRSCGPCPHLAHFEKAKDPGQYLGTNDVPPPNIKYQNHADTNPQLGVGNAYVVPDLKVKPHTYDENMYRQQMQTMPEQYHMEQPHRQTQQESFIGGMPPCKVDPVDCRPCLETGRRAPTEPCPQSPYHLSEVKKKYTGVRPEVLKPDKIECECPLTIDQLPQPKKPPEPFQTNGDEKPPCYLPQPEDKIPVSVTTGMGPLGPWATGRVDWGPLAGLTGTRPVVDRYSIARYSEGDWRQHNQDVFNMSRTAQHRNNLIEWNGRQCMAQLQADADKNQEDNTKRLTQREKEIHRWKCELERAISAASEEISFMEEQRRRLKQASAVLQLPESIAGECLERRTGRLDSELVRDEVEVELMKERALCDEIRQQFIQTLKDVELQLVEDKTAKQRLELDWSDKKQAFETDATARSLTLRSTILMFKPGSVIFPGDQSTPEYWDHFTKETLQMAETTRQRSVTLRGTLDAILNNAAKDLRDQADKVELVLAKRIKCLVEVIDNLENDLRKVLQNLADIERLINDLQTAIRRMDLVLKKAQTRLDLRLHRERIENCRDECQFGLIEEVKLIGEESAALAAQLKQADDSQAELSKVRNELEKEIMIKRKSMEIDRARTQQFRSYYPSATALQGYA